MTAEALKMLKKKAFKPSKMVQPFLKWAGGKRQLLREIRTYVPGTFNRYFEPFVGGGAVLFDVQPGRAYINDANEELINLYAMIRRFPLELMEEAKKHRNSEEYFYQLRAQDRDSGFGQLTAIERAARILFLNKTCYNGLFRVNSHGHFNVPFGNYANPVIVDEAVIKAVHQYFNDSDIIFSTCDFEEAVATAGRGDFVYLDPPYDPISESASFTGYSVGNFSKADQRRLKNCCDALTQRGCNLLQSNSATDFIRELYSDNKRYTLIEVEANRNINSVAAGRGKVSELLVLGKAAFE